MVADVAMKSGSHSASSVSLRAQQAGSIEAPVHRLPPGAYVPKSSRHWSPGSPLISNRAMPAHSPPQVSRRVRTVMRFPSQSCLERPLPFTQEQMSFLEDMHMATVSKCKRMQDAVIDNVCECVQGFLKSCDEQLKVLSNATQALSVSLDRQVQDFETSCEFRVTSTVKGLSTQGTPVTMASSWAEMFGSEKDPQQTFADSIATSIKTLRAQMDLDEERTEIPVPSMSGHLKQLQDVAARVNSAFREGSALAVHVAPPPIIEDNRCKEVPREVESSLVQQSRKEVPREVRTSMVQQDVTQSAAKTEQSDDGLADLLTKVQALEQHVKRHVTVKPPWVAAITHN